MSDNPLDRIPSFDRISLRAVVVPDGVDPGPALAAAGIFDPIALPIVFGENPPDRSFGDGFTPNVTAVLEYDQPAAGDSRFDSEGRGSGFNGDPALAGGESGAPGSASDDAQPAGPPTISLPTAYGMQPQAPVRPYGPAPRNAGRADATPPTPSVFAGAWSSPSGRRPDSIESASDQVLSPEPVRTAPTPPFGEPPPMPDPGSAPLEGTAYDPYTHTLRRIPPPTAGAAQASDGAPPRTVDSAAPPPQATAPVPFVDDKGQAYLNFRGKPMMRPAGLDPHFFVEQGLRDKQAEDLLSSGSEAGAVAALGYKAGALAHLRRGGPWDAQRLGGTDHPEFVDYSTVAIGLYAAANGMSREEILEVEDLEARRSHFQGNPEMDKTYTHLPVRNIKNTDFGYWLYQSGRVTATSKP